MNAYFLSTPPKDLSPANFKDYASWQAIIHCDELAVQQLQQNL